MNDDAKTLDDLYQTHGFDVYNCSWLKNNGYNKLYRRIIAEGKTLIEVGAEAGHHPETVKTILVKELDRLYAEKGISVYFSSWLKDNGYNGFYQKLTGQGLRLDDLAEEAGRLKEKREFRGIMQPILYTQEELDKIANELIEDYQSIPSHEWLRNNGYGRFSGFMATKSKETLDQMRERLGVNQNSQFISRDGINWNSFAEACFANFLYARGIEFRKGDMYPPEYSKMSGQTYGKYDIHFKASIGQYENKWIDVEIFGCPRNSGVKEHYELVRKAKEKFNETNDLFLGLEYSSCYKEKDLVTILEKYIGSVDPFVFASGNDAKIPSTCWSISDRLIQQCKEISERMPDKVLPTGDWMACANHFKGRVRDPWEASYRWFTIKLHIINMGGFFKVRQLLGQTASRRKWSRGELVEALSAFWDEHEKSPAGFESNVRNAKKAGDVISDDTKETLKLAAKLQKVCQNHGGYASIREEAGLPGRPQKKK